MCGSHGIRPIASVCGLPQRDLNILCIHAVSLFLEMELYPLRVFLTIAAEKSFSRAAERLLRTQPAVSLALQRLEAELGEKLIDRSAKELVLTDAGSTVLEFARRFESLRHELENSLAELRDKSSGRLVI